MTDSPEGEDGGESAKETNSENSPREALRSAPQLLGRLRKFCSDYAFGVVALAAAALITFGGLIGFWVLDEQQPFECSTLQNEELQRSTDSLASSVEHQLKLDVEATDRLLAERERRGSGGDTSDLDDRIRVAAEDEMSTRDTLLRLYRDDLRFGHRIAEEEVRAKKIADAVGVLEIIVAEGRNATRPTVSFDADSEFPVVVLGSSRADKRQEITLVSTANGVDEQAAEESASEMSPARPLLSQASYKTDFGQFVSESNHEIPQGDISVWARRLGSNLLFSVCIDPANSLGAGEYVGTVFLDDPRVDADSLQVTVTAQHRRIDLLYLLLVILPPLAMAYVWYVTEQDPTGPGFKFGSFLKWTQERFIVLLGVGLASIWTTLQVALNNPTLGSSLTGAVAVVGGAAVATTTAMTTIAITAGAARRRAEAKDPPEQPAGQEPSA